jgi:hypothetical protein
MRQRSGQTAGCTDAFTDAFARGAAARDGPPAAGLPAVAGAAPITWGIVDARPATPAGEEIEVDP